MQIQPLGDRAISLELDPRPTPAAIARAQAVTESLRQHLPCGVDDVQPVYGSITIHFDPAMIDPDSREFADWLAAHTGTEAPARWLSGRRIEIPICYDRSCAPDLQSLSKQQGLKERELAELHASVTYIVGAVGFLPGFAYLLGLPAGLQSPRLSTPRKQVPAGSIGIGGAQTGIYPCVSPGGWNLIGRTPLSMFDPNANPAARLAVGDRVAFRPISMREFVGWK